MQGDGLDAAYAYTSEGDRIFKTVDGEKTEYRLNGSTILSETTGSETLFYYYDAGGALVEIGWQKDGEEQKYYAVVRNGQGDVTGLCDAATMTPIGSYTYDAWGKPLSVVAAEGAEAYDPGDVLHKQPFRYRGYYYDSETGYYYLQSRYYDPLVRRFLNADTILAETDDSLGYNLFAYCLNDPVNQTDPSGTMTNEEMVMMSLHIMAALAFTAAVLSLAGPAAAAAAACVATGAALGSMAGGVIGAASGAAAGVTAHVVTTGSFEGAGQAAVDMAAVGMLGGTIAGGIVGGAAGAAGATCFVEGTPVLAAEGLVLIEAISAGDIVWAEDPESGEQSLSSVVQTFENETEVLVHVTVEGDTITSTPHHPFYSPVKGWTDALDLRAGDILVRSNGEYVIVEQVQHEILENPVKVYNFEVQDYHTYYVGCREVLVHNMCMPKVNGVGNPVKVVGKGNTGRTTPYTLFEQMAMHQVKSDPLTGATQLRLSMGDSRWPKEEGWVKMQNIVKGASGQKANIHYVFNRITGAFDDFKFK